MIERNLILAWVAHDAAGLDARPGNPEGRISSRLKANNSSPMVQNELHKLHNFKKIFGPLFHNCKNCLLKTMFKK